MITRILSWLTRRRSPAPVIQPHVPVPIERIRQHVGRLVKILEPEGRMLFNASADWAFLGPVVLLSIDDSAPYMATVGTSTGDKQRTHVWARGVILLDVPNPMHRMPMHTLMGTALT